VLGLHNVHNRKIEIGLLIGGLFVLFLGFHYLWVVKRLPNIQAKEYFTRLLVVMFAAISPFLCVVSLGVEVSLSAYWNTDLQPLFIIANFSTAYYLLGIKNWEFSAVLLMGLTSFSVDLYGELHNTLAVLFFIANLYPLYKTNHYKWIIFVYLTSLIVLPIFGMLWAEILAIEALCAHQLLLLNKVYKISNSDESNHTNAK
jgi:hypothetical protein